MSGTRAIIFDLDGVLYDTSDAHREAFQRALAPLGIDNVPYDRIAGMRTDQAIRLLVNEASLTVSEADVARLTETKRACAKELIPTMATVYDGSSDVIQALSSRYSLALASSSSRHNIESYLAASGTKPHFTSILGGDDVISAKPAPDIFIASLRNLSVSPAEALVVEDSESGIRAARSAGIAVVGISTMLTPQNLTELGASYVLPSVAKLMEIL